MSGSIDMARKNWTFTLPDKGYPSKVMGCIEHFVDHADPPDLAGRQYTFAQIARLLGKHTVDEDVMRALNYLMSVGAVEVVYLFIEEDGSLTEVFSPVEVFEAKEVDCLPHPRTGRCVSNFESRLVPVFMFSSEI